MSDATRRCRWCDGSIPDDAPSFKVFCEYTCKNGWHQARRVRDSETRSHQQRVRKQLAGRPVAGDVVSVPCLECGETMSFTLKPAGRYPRLCSPVCKQRRRRRLELEQRFGITLEEYEARLVQQGGRCAICDTEDILRGGHRYAAVDHCHKSSAVRGLLCYRCNLAIGQFEDDLDRLRTAARYLEANGLPSPV